MEREPGGRPSIVIRQLAAFAEWEQGESGCLFIIADLSPDVLVG
jgi:hypothetical protein